MNKVREAGKYTLELACVVVGLVGLLLGGSDIGLLLQGRSAVRAGVEEAARCLITTDSSDGCRLPVSSNGTVTVPGRYDVFASGYEIPYPLVSAVGRWQEVPEFSATIQRYTGNVDVQYGLPAQRLATASVRFPVTATSEYLLESSPPVYLSGSSFSPQFRSIRNRNQVIDPATREILTGLPSRVTNAPAVGDVSDDGEYADDYYIGSTTFTVNALDAPSQVGLSALRQRGVSPTCFQPREFNPATGWTSQGIVGGTNGNVANWMRVNELEPCGAGEGRSNSTAFFSSTSVLVPVAFQVLGGSAVSAVGVEGKLSIQAEWRNPAGVQQVRQLGGRVFSGRVVPNSDSSGLLRASQRQSSSGSLVVRGLSEDRIAQSVRNEYPIEYAKHSSPLYVPDGQSVTLKFYLRKTSGGAGTSVAWSGTALRLYYPEYRFVSERLYDHASVSPTNCVRSNEEHASAGTLHLAAAPLTKCELISGNGPIVSEIAEPTCRLSSSLSSLPLEGNKEARIARIWSEALTIPGSITGSQQFQYIHEGCSDLEQSYSCPSTGSVGAYAGCDEGVTSRSELGACAAQLPSDARNVRVLPRDAVSTQHIVAIDGCSVKDSIPSCATLTRVPGKQRIVPGSADTSRCIDVSSHELRVQPYQYPNATSPEKCQEELDKNAATIRAEQKIPAAADFVVRCDGTHWGFVADRPVETTPFRATAPGQLELIATGVSKRYADQICGGRDGVCESRPRPSREIVLNQIDAKNRGSVDLAQVAEVMFNAAQAIYPATVPCVPTRNGVGASQCVCPEGSSSNCLGISLSDNPTSGEISVGASMGVPTRALATLSKDRSVVSHSMVVIPEDRIAR